MTTSLINKVTIRKFAELLHARAASALADTGDPGVLHLCTMGPNDKALCTVAVSVGDIDRTVEVAVSNAEAGRNVYVEARTVRPGLPGERGKAGATVGVFAFVIDHDADTGKAGHYLNGTASAVVETSPGNSHSWLFLERALSADGAKSIGNAIRKASGADACTGVVTQPYRVPGTPNYPDAKKVARGRTVVATRLLRSTDKVWSVDDLAAAFHTKTALRLKMETAQPTEKVTGALNGGGPTRTAPRIPTAVKLKVTRKASPKMDRSRQFQAAVAAAVRAGMTPDELEALLRQHPEGCASKYLDGGDRLRQEIDRSYDKVRAPADDNDTAEPTGGRELDGAALLDDVRAFLARFVIYPSEEAHTAHTLWVVHTHFMDSWESTPRLAFLSAEPESGKTRALEVSNLLVPNPVDAVNVSASYLFRKVAAGAPTILFDEIDTVFGTRNGNATNNEDIRGLLNAGHRRGAVAGRCVVQGNTVLTEELPAYAAVALAGLGDLPDTILSRAIIVRMNRRAPGERVEPFRARLHTKEGHALRDRLIAWTKGTRITGWPTLPDEVTDRAADCWEPLIAVADLAGGKWPGTARAAAIALVTRLVEDRREASLGLRLLSDMRVVLGKDPHKTTVAILDRLQKLDESPWTDIKGKPLTDRGLAVRLRHYGIKPVVLKTGPKSTARGYRKDDFADAWHRYLPPLPSSGEA
jgi:uncharacterized protein DUF3631